MITGAPEVRIEVRTVPRQHSTRADDGVTCIVIDPGYLNIWIVIGIGDLVLSADGSKRLLPPTGGKPYFITTQPISSLLRDLRDKKSLFGMLLVVTGSLTILFGGLLARRVWRNLKKKRAKEELQRRLNQSRRTRRQNVRDDDMPDNLRCVVCQENPKEVIMLPCGHLCVCEDCSDRLGTSCPICRAHVTTKAAAFLS